MARCLCTAWTGSILLLAACTPTSGSGGSPSTAAPSIAAPVTRDATIETLSIDEPAWQPDGDDWVLELAWQSPAGITIDHYEVRRNGVTIDRDVASATFSDADVEPGTRYRYTVVGVDAEGIRTAGATAALRTGEPKLALARLEGSFVVRMTVDRASGTADPVRGGAISFTFDPACRSGPCPVGWSVRHARAGGTLRRDDTIYQAKLRTPLFIRNCFGDLVDEALVVRLRVTRAAPLEGEWRATKIEGSIKEVSSYGGCVTASIDWNVHGSLQN
jgi:hypothetical protein